MASGTTNSRVPVRAQMFDGSGDPKNGKKTVAALGNMTRTWALYLEGLGSGSQSLVQIEDETLNAVGPTTLTTDATADEGGLLAFIVRQGTAGCLIEWDSMVFQNAPTGIDVRVNTESLFLFLRHNGFWLFLLYWTGKGLSA